MSKTVKQHLDETSEITKHLKDGDALIEKMRRELEITRRALEWMTGFNHPDFRRSARHEVFNPLREDAPATLKEVADHRVQAINSLLGDRA